MSKSLKKIRERAAATFKKRKNNLGEDTGLLWFEDPICDHSTTSAYIEAWDQSDEDVSRSGCTSSVTSTNATADDLPGPGRIVDKYIYRRGGRIIERFVTKWKMSTLHPAYIVRYLSPLPTTFTTGFNVLKLESIIFTIETRHGPAVIAGLKSLVQQTQ